mmetsp:Transcript_12718/g.10874  ORF Transcript_12718/g.10874 Transcript_12718/m.10874 type:complete len:156 (+) Transcript_12718:64-531(+)
MVDQLKKDKKTTENDPVIVTESYKKAAFTISPYYKPYISEVIVPEGFINSRIEKLAHSIANYYQDRPYTIVAVMNASYKVFGKLNEYLEKIYQAGTYKNALKVEFVRLTSYTGIKNSEDVEVLGLDLINVKDREILVVENIVETGLSLGILLDKL